MAVKGRIYPGGPWLVRVQAKADVVDDSETRPYLGLPDEDDALVGYGALGFRIDDAQEEWKVDLVEDEYVEDVFVYEIVAQFIENVAAVDDSETRVQLGAIEDSADEFDDGDLQQASEEDAVLATVEASEEALEEWAFEVSAQQVEAEAVAEFIQSVLLDADEEPDTTGYGALGFRIDDPDVSEIWAHVDEFDEMPEWYDELYDQRIEATAAQQDDSELRPFAEAFDEPEPFDDQLIAQFIEDAAPLEDAPEARPLVEFEFEDDEQRNGYGALGFRIDDAFVSTGEEIQALVEHLDELDDWSLELYAQVIEDAAAVTDAPELRVLLEREFEDESYSKIGALLGFEIEEIFEVLPTLDEQLQDDATWAYELLQQVIEDAAVAPEDSETRVWLEQLQEEQTDAEWAHQLIQQIIEDAVVLEDTNYALVLLPDEAYEEPDYSGQLVGPLDVEDVAAVATTYGIVHHLGILI